MINTKAFIGSPTNFRDICFIYPPKIKDVINVDKYPVYQKILTISAEEIFDELNKPPVEDKPQFTIPIGSDLNMAPKPIHYEPKLKQQSPLEYILINAYHDPNFLQILKEAFQFFTKCDILPLYDKKSIYVGNLEDISSYGINSKLPILDEDNFLDFQNEIRNVLGIKKCEVPDKNEDPRITRMKAKARYRDKLKAQGAAGINFGTMLASICCMGIGITPLNIGEISYSAAQTLFAIYQNKEKYGLDTSSLLAGADPKNVKLKYWINNLDD